MKFTYEYRTSDNVRHTGVISASDREAAFAALKAQGIRPGSVREAAGFFNKFIGKGKRWTAIAILAVLAATFAAVMTTTRRELKEAVATFDSTARRQPIGDTAIIEKGIKDGWASVFSDEGHRFLASFAIPGAPPAVRTTSEQALREAVAREAGSGKNEGIEERQIRAMVEGLKDEVRQCFADGWTFNEIRRALMRRQEQEIGYYQMAKNEIERARQDGKPEIEVVSLWEKRNENLRKMGIRLVSFPAEN